MVFERTPGVYLLPSVYVYLQLHPRPVARLSVLIRTDNLADQENGLLVRKVGNIGHDRASGGRDGSLDLLHGVELEGALDAVGGGIARRGTDDATHKWRVRQLVVRSGGVESRASETERGFVAGADGGGRGTHRATL